MSKYDDISQAMFHLDYYQLINDQQTAVRDEYENKNE
jgi:hypothetical protein